MSTTVLRDYLQDGVPPQIAWQVTALLRAHFGDKRVISKGFRTALLPRSLDLNPCDFWLWGFLKNHAYRGNIQTVPELKESIPCHVSSIDRETLRATVEHAIIRFERMIDANGMHNEQLYD